MAGVLSFIITADSAGFTQGANRAGTSIQSLRMSAAATNQGMRAIGSAMTLIGFQVAPQLTSAVLIGTTALRALNSAAIATGIGLGGIGLAAAGVTAAFFTWSEAIKLVKAEMAWDKSIEGMDNQYEALRSKLIPELERAAKLGRITQNQLVGAKNWFVGVNSPEAQAAAIKNAQGILRPLQVEDQRRESGFELASVVKQLQIQFMPQGPEREKAELSLAMDKIVSKISELATKAGVSDEDPMRVVNRIVDSERARIDREAGTPRGLGGAMLGGQDVTAWERIGLVMGSGPSRNDDQRKTATNTSLIVSGIQNLPARIAAVLPKQPPMTNQ